jgi:hypothetical protein
MNHWRRWRSRLSGLKFVKVSFVSLDVHQITSPVSSSIVGIVVSGAEIRNAQ